GAGPHRTGPRGAAFSEGLSGASTPPQRATPSPTADPPCSRDKPRCGPAEALPRASGVRAAQLPHDRPRKSRIDDQRVREARAGRNDGGLSPVRTVAGGHDMGNAPQLLRGDPEHTLVEGLTDELAIVAEDPSADLTDRTGVGDLRRQLVREQREQRRAALGPGADGDHREIEMSRADQARRDLLLHLERSA